MKTFLFFAFFIGVGIWWYKRSEAKKVKGLSIIESWFGLIEEANGSKKRIYKEVKEKINALEPPNIVVSEQTITSGSMIGRSKRDYLMVKNSRINGWVMYIGAHDYGKQLFVSWYLIEEPTGLMLFVKIMTAHWAAALIFFPVWLLGVIIERLRGKASPAQTDIFDIEEQIAYVTVVRDSVLESAEEICEELDQDFSKVEVKSRGFLNIS